MSMSLKRVERALASRSISAILWTLVSVNSLTLVVGGLITWLGYAIPVRLKQFGLLPELVIIAGFASLVVACLGLCAINYSSHYSLNVYAGSCAVFVLMLVLGIPENWYKSDHFDDSGATMTIIYFSLLFILLVLLVFSFTFAHYLRRQSMAAQEELDSTALCQINHQSSQVQVTSLNRSNHIRRQHNYQSPFASLCSCPNECHLNANPNNCPIALEGLAQSARRSHLQPASNARKPRLSCHLSSTQLSETSSTLVNNQTPPCTCQHLSALRAQELARENCEQLGSSHQSAIQQEHNNFYGCSNLLGSPTAARNKTTPRQQCTKTPPPLLNKAIYKRSHSWNKKTFAKARSCTRFEADQDDSFQQAARCSPADSDDYPPLASNAFHRSSIELSTGRFGSSNHDDEYRQQVAASLPFNTIHVHSSRYSGSNRQHQHHNLALDPGTDYSAGTLAGNSCRCSCGPTTSAAPNSISQPFPTPSYTLPIQSNSLKNKIKKKPKSGASSVMAMTAAAAAALLGGVTDMSSMGRLDGNDGMFAGADEAVLMDVDRCNFQNDHHLDVSMLDAQGFNDDGFFHHHQTQQHQDAQQPVFDLVPLMDMSRKQN